ncbi:MAG: ATP-binding protein [Candidatus Pacebacteria bacterium]|nr:ATP-binding protein [Candidatus Paceibacterota bacterium]
MEKEYECIKCGTPLFKGENIGLVKMECSHCGHLNKFLDKEEFDVFRLAFLYASDHIIITDKDAVIIYANLAMEKITGFSKEEVIGKKAGSKGLWGGYMPPDFYKKMWHMIKEEKKIFTGVVQNRRKNGEIYEADVSIAPVLDENGEVKYFVGIERDITKEKEIELAKNEFISLASHQLRTPLTGIRWVVEEFLKREKMSERGMKYLKNIEFSTIQLNKLVDDLLNVSKIEDDRIDINPKLMDVVDFIQNYLLEATPLFVGKKLKIIFDKHPLKLEVKMDENAFRNIIQSLVSNSVEYTREGGEVEISLEENENNFLVDIRDTGIGIPKGEQKIIFKKFSRASNAKKEKAGGTGLGLYMVKNIIAMLNGEIRFESEENKGTTFYVKLPKEVKKKKMATEKENLL